MDDEMSSTLHKQINAKKKQLSTLLSTAVKPLGFSYKYPTLNQSVKTTASTFSTISAIQAVKDANKTGTKKKGIAGSKKIKIRFLPTHSLTTSFATDYHIIFSSYLLSVFDSFDFSSIHLI